jgi:ubiquinone/menaquinone biosynthesis C-methylase UbiE
LIRRWRSAFLDRRSQTHAQALLALPDEHWRRLVRMLGLVGHRAVLDVGCGPGAWLPALAETNSRVVGVDIDESSLALAKIRGAGVDNIELQRMAAESLDFADGTFDAVTCVSTLPYVDQRATIAQMARVLTPDGSLVIGTAGPGYYAKHIVEGSAHLDLAAIRYGADPLAIACVRTLGGSGVARQAVQSWSPQAVRAILERGGFRVERVLRNVDAADPTWPTSCLGAPLYFIVFATRLG